MSWSVIGCPPIDDLIHRRRTRAVVLESLCHKTKTKTLAHASGYKPGYPLAAASICACISGVSLPLPLQFGYFEQPK